MDKKISRRQAVAGAAGLAAGVAGIQAGLAQDSTPAASPGATPAAQQDVVKSSVPGVPDAILRAPAPFKSYEGAPGNGGTVKYAHLIYGAPATGHDDNVYWQELEKRLNVERLEVQEIPVAAYEEKVSALLASGDLGDLFYLNAGEGGAAAINQAIQQGAFTDLTEELTTNLANYPNLATLPQAMWDQSKINGKIYGVPNPIYQGTNLTFYRADWAAKLGLAAPTNADEHAAILQAFRDNDPDGNGSKDTYGLGTSNANFISPMFRVPNGWRLNEDGTLTNAVETEEWLRTIEFRKKLWDGQAIHPDAPTVTQQQFRDLFLGGQTGALSEGFGTWWGAGGTKQTIKDLQPEADLQPFMPVGWDGGPGTMFPLPAYYGTVAIPSKVGGDSERMKELLRICDYFYPPFGSEEFNFLTYGIEGVHHTVDADGGRTLTPQGEADVAQLIYGFGAAALYIYLPGFPDQALEWQKIVEAVMPLAVMNPTIGLFSQANLEKGPAIGTLITDAANDVIYGRRNIDELAGVLDDWRSQGGDEIRKEFEELLKQ